MDLQLKRSQLRLIYFNAQGRGELIRLVLHAAEKDFVDKRINPAEWPSLKSKMPFGQLPVLEVKTPGGDTLMLSDSMAITRLLARTFGLYGNDASEVYLIEQINSLTTSLLEEIYSFNLKNADNFAKIVTVEHLYEYFDAIEMVLRNRQSTFIVGNRVTLADLQILVLVDTIDKFLSKFRHGCMDKLNEIKENVLRQKPEIARYLRSRPVTDF